MIRRPQSRGLLLAGLIVLVAVLPGLAGGQSLTSTYADPCNPHCENAWSTYGNLFYEGSKKNVVVVNEGGLGHVRLTSGSTSGSIIFTHDVGVTAQPFVITSSYTAPPGTSVVFDARSSDDGRIFSDWYTNMAQVPPAHVLQVRATLASIASPNTPDITSIAIKYDPPDYCWGGSSVYANCYGTGHVETLGSKKMIAIRLRFLNDNPWPQGFDEAWARSWMSQLNDWLVENSYGQMSLDGTPVCCGDVSQVISLPFNGTCDYYALSAQVLEALDSYIDFHAYNYVWFIRQPDPSGQWCPGVGSWGSSWMKPPRYNLPLNGQAFLAYQWNDTVGGMANGLMHEFVHGLWTSHSGYRQPCNWCDAYDVMGTGFAPNTATATNAIHKETIGWLKAPRITRVTQNGTFTIDALEAQTSNLKVLKIGPAGAEPFYAELRLRIGFDVNIPSPNPEGVILHRIVPGVPYGSPVDNTLFNPYNTPDDPNGYPADVVLKPNMHFTDSATGYTIVLRSSTSSTATLQVCIPGNISCQIIPGTRPSKARPNQSFHFA